MCNEIIKDEIPPDTTNPKAVVLNRLQEFESKSDELFYREARPLFFTGEETLLERQVIEHSIYDNKFVNG